MIGSGLESGIGMGLEIPFVALLGVAAGFLTTLSGMGGGLLLITALSALWGPHQALPVTTLSLLVGNLHRFALYRPYVRTDMARPLLLGLVPGSAIGSFMVASLPAALLQVTMLVLVGVALLGAALRLSWRVPRAALVPAGAVVGLIAATAGGAALLISPLLLATGVRGNEYIATITVTAFAMHVARLAGYGAGGLVNATTVTWACLLAVTLVAGNLLGHAARNRLSERARGGLEYGTLGVAGLLALIGAA